MAKKNIKKPNNKLKYSLFFILAILIPLILVYYMNLKTNDSDIKQTTESPDIFKKEGELSFISTDNKSLKKIDIEIADDDAQRQLGLMFRPFMRENNGMLFIFPSVQPLSFWMKNTLISLDMFFIDENLNIVTIHKNTTPFSEQSYPAASEGKYVVETVSGFADKFNIKTGDKIYFSYTK